MPFKKINTSEEVKKRLNNDNELKNEYLLIQKEYEIIKQFKQIRKEKGLTQKQISKLSGLTQQMVSRIENANNSPTLHNLNKYANSLGVDLVPQKRRKIG